MYTLTKSTLLVGSLYSNLSLSMIAIKNSSIIRVVEDFLYCEHQMLELCEPSNSGIRNSLDYDLLNIISR